MTSPVEMSLDDIIQKKKKEKPKKPIGNLPPSNKLKQPFAKKLAIADARNKIISKKRTQITDARDKLAELAKQKDARLKLEKLRQERMAKLPRNQGGARPIPQGRGKFVRNTQNKDRVFVDQSRQVVYQPLQSRKPQFQSKLNTKKFLESRSVGPRSNDRPFRPKPIVRTVENDIEIIDDDDPMGEEEYIPSKPTLLNRKASLQLKIIAHNDVRSSGHRMAITERDKSPPKPPSILKKRPMAALRSDQIAQKTEIPVMEYRIIVSNLRNTVTGGDIKELFGDIGGMMESRLVRPGTAEVIYKTQEDAQKAVELYHNRQLDGQPMNCLLVTPRTPTALQKTTTKPALYSTNSNVEPDISTFHKVLFSNL